MAGMAAIWRLTPWDRVVAWYRGSVLNDIVNFLKDGVFGVELGEYEHLPMGENLAKTVQTVVLVLMLGALAEAAVVVYTKTVPGGFIRKLLQMQANDRDTAVTLMQSGYFRSVGIRRDLKNGGTLAKLVCREGDPEGLTLAGTRVPEQDEMPKTKKRRRGETEHETSIVERLNADTRISTPKGPAATQAMTAGTPENETVNESAGTSASVSVSDKAGAPNGGANNAETATRDAFSGVSGSQGANKILDESSGEPTNQETQGDPAETTETEQNQKTETVRAVNFLTDRFYIPANLRGRAEARMSAKGSGIKTFLLSGVAIFAAGFLLCRLAPLFLNLVNGILSLM